MAKPKKKKDFEFTQNDYIDNNWQCLDYHDLSVYNKFWFTMTQLSHKVKIYKQEVAAVSGCARVQPPSNHMNKKFNPQE